MGRRVARFRTADTNVEQLVGAMTGALTIDDDDPTATASGNGRGAA
jgi:simple sugar transport system ATP-binding protein